MNHHLFVLHVSYVLTPLTVIRTLLYCYVDGCVVYGLYTFLPSQQPSFVSRRTGGAKEVDLGGPGSVPSNSTSNHITCEPQLGVEAGGTGMASTCGDGYAH